jgi:hypothetical protein
MWLFRDVIQTLIPTDAENIIATSVAAGTVHTVNGDVRGAGNARRTTPSAQAQVTFALRTSSFRTARLGLKFAVSRAAKVAVMIDSKTVDTDTVAADDLTFYDIDIDLTAVTEAASDVTLRVDFDFAGDGTAYFFEDEPNATTLTQPFAWRRAVQAAVWFSAALLLLLSIVFLLTGLVTTIRTEYRAYGLLFVAIVAAYHVLGLPELGAIAPRQWFRRLFAMTQPRRTIAAMLLSIAALFGVWQSVRLAQALYRRQRYTDAVRHALADVDALNESTTAFLIYPWRREAQMLIERNAYGLRSCDNAALQQYLQRLIANRAFERAALAPSERDARDIRMDEGVTCDPAVWYVSLLLEAKVPHAAQRGVKSLANRVSEESDVQRTFLDFKMSEKNPAAEERAASTLQRLLDHPRLPAFKTSFLYQNGQDALAAYHIEKMRRLVDACRPACNDGQRAAIRGELGMAQTCFQEVLDRRAEALQTDSPKWLRPPQKLYTYYVALDLQPSCIGPARAVDLAKNYAFGNAVARNIPWDGKYDLLQKQLQVPPDLDTAPEWLVGSVQDVKIRDEISKRLEDGWRH